MSLNICNPDALFYKAILIVITRKKILKNVPIV